MPHCSNCGRKLGEGETYCSNCGTLVGTVGLPILASWGKRFVAWLIDIIILAAILAMVKMFIWISWPNFVWAPDFARWIPFVDFGMDNVIYLFYWMFMEGIYGQSIGKMILGLEVTRLSGEPVSMAQSAIESVGKAFLLPIDCIIGWVLYPRKRQRLFNYISGTIVVRAWH